MTIVPKGAPEGQYANYFYLENREKVLEMPATAGDYEVRLNGKVIGSGKGAGKDVRPDREGFDLTLPAGKHTVAIVLKGGGEAVAFARFLDPDRKLKYPDAPEKK